MWQTIKQQIQQWGTVLLIAPSIAGLVILGSNAGLFRMLEWASQDQLFRLRPKESVDERIVLVTIDEPDIKYVKQWPMSDRVMAQLIRNIKAQQPRAIGIDIYRDLVVEPGHDELVEVFNSTPNVIGIEKIAGNPIAAPPVLDKLSQVAANDVLLDGDSKIRRGIILLGKPDGTRKQGFGVKLALMYLAQDGIKLEPINPDKKIYGLGKAKFFPLSSNDGEYSKAEMGGYQILLNYRGGEESFLTISMTDVLDNRIPPNLMSDRIVLLGAKAPSLNDNHLTPYNSTLLTPTELIPGIAIHANISSQILSAANEGRPMLRASVKSLNWLWIVFWSGYSATLGAMYVRRRWVTGVGTLIAGVIIITSSYIAFLFGWLIPIFTPLFTVISAAVVSITTTLWNNLKQSYRELEKQHKLLQEAHRQLEKTNTSYSRFVPFEYLNFLQKDTILDVYLGNHVSKEMAVMFSDIRSFTTLSETMTPKENFDFVNAYLKRVSPEIRNQNGFIVKFLGDGIMAVFPDGTDEAVAAGIAKQIRVEEYNHRRIAKGYLPIKVGIGIHVGQMMVGMVGETFRMQGDAFSDNVNLTARLEGLTKFYGVSLLISEQALEQLSNPSQYQIRFLDRAIVKGKNEPIAVYEILEGEPEQVRELKLTTQSEFELAIEYYRTQEFEKAKACFNQVLAVNPNDKTALLYVDRINQLMVQGVPQNWDGVWRFTQK
ncbi:MAG: CHASE2 domain-containing protein [Moorea sp. SIO4G2]|uniref:CHASE2 domain-containing protein n=1 Tax=Moorena sp. SIO3I6 TaxID=2607831 RepID=UPI0013FADA5F|nr:CHASE2 domain-containing protein [Moorena sp. SIO3I6]NEO59941.1 CHASE2 domain-containing protein [Moorena sp. SIO4G2]NEP27094.1 CHASE2 domain-containing protein [Moorena sp. SIO3I6]